MILRHSFPIKWKTFLSIFEDVRQEIPTRVARRIFRFNLRMIANNARSRPA